MKKKVVFVSERGVEFPDRQSAYEDDRRLPGIIAHYTERAEEAREGLSKPPLFGKSWSAQRESVRQAERMIAKYEAMWRNAQESWETVADDRPGCVDGVVFGVSCDNGATAVSWRENVHEALDYMDLQNSGLIDPLVPTYCVVVHRTGV